MDVDEWGETDLSTEVVAGLTACNSQGEEFGEGDEAMPVE